MIVPRTDAVVVLTAATKEYPELPIFDVRKTRLWALRNSLHVDWETVRLGYVRGGEQQDESASTETEHVVSNVSMLWFRLCLTCTCGIGYIGFIVSSHPKHGITKCHEFVHTCYYCQQLQLSHIPFWILRKLYSILPPRGERMLVAGGEREVANGLLLDCVARLKESGYVLHVVVELPEEQPSDWPRAVSLDIDLGPKLLLWRPSPVISECFPVILQTLQQQHVPKFQDCILPGSALGDTLQTCTKDDVQRELGSLSPNTMTMLDLAAGSGRDVVPWAQTVVR